MCGIIAVVRRPGARRPPPQASEVLDLVERAARRLSSVEVSAQGALSGAPLEALSASAELLGQADAALHGAPGVTALVRDRPFADQLELVLLGVEARGATLEAALDGGGSLPPSDLEALNAAMVSFKDAAWALSRDRLRTARAVEEMAGASAGDAAIAAYTSIQQALSAIDRLEVRGRDSAGLHVLVSGHGLDLDSPALAEATAARRGDRLFGSMAVRHADGCLGFVYKAAAEIGELGDNTKALRAAIRSDPVLRDALSAETAQAVVLGHTRWASVGIISVPNAHPLDSLEEDRPAGPYVTAALNGDVDNFADLKSAADLSISPEITTDAKVIPTLVARQLEGGADLLEGFRSAANKLDGSVAVAASAAAAPGDLLLALRGSGQALYIGLAEDAYVVASEPYGVVEDARRYVRMDGDTPADPANPATRGQIVRLRGDLAGDVAGIERLAYDGTELRVDGLRDVASAEITTRDIDRGDSPHFLLKEISQAPASFRKTLRGKLLGPDGACRAQLPDSSLPRTIRSNLASGAIRKVIAIGQGTAAVAGQSLSMLLRAIGADAHLEVSSILATELSGFELREDMSDTLIVAISQSGTTTDTNRTVDLARARGAAVISIVNRRGSDLTDHSDGVLYTSDGRDVEMAVASTKAFYSQIAACCLLAFAIAEEVGLDPARDHQDLLQALRELPLAMERTLERREDIAAAAAQLAPSRRYWAIVGNGVNRIAAAELRIKLSELCYKSIACDSTEDKKHVDLSSEPLILVCATGLTGSTADDVAKEVAIYRAHKAAPIVLATEGEERFGSALQAIFVPPTHPTLAFVLSAMAGHLFGYEAALAIDAGARPLREARAAIEAALPELEAGDGEIVLGRLAPVLAPAAGRFFDSLRAGELDGHLSAAHAVRLASLLRYELGMVPLDSYQAEHGKVGTPAVVTEDLLNALTRAIDELTRPVDAIKHQAKTVTVGISRSDETLLRVPLVQAVLAAGAARDRLSYESLRTLAALQPLVDAVAGHTRYAVEESSDGKVQTAVVVDTGGLGRELRSRTADNPVLRGTKHRVATERQVLLAKGRSDGRTVLIVPEVKEGTTVGLVLLHVRLADRLEPAPMRAAMQGYRDRYQALKDAVTETEPLFRDDLLGELSVLELMTSPIVELADRWRV